MVQKSWAGFKELCVEGAEEDQPQHRAEAKGRGVAGWAHTTAQGRLVPSTGGWDYSSRFQKKKIPCYQAVNTRVTYH